ncbi:hypothetical protein NHX12_014124 [Muraenolepis orangiensis]|uniref:Alpha-type protein kinase domain-containing protein n=1 Tax=Muraenolepis orangiensis TaxID=630683 RepID=A0A9Q0DBD7_9TELE|nr:hypothetical protein NHX12_014124 [Muraenolepis orangiensis]
MDSQEVGVWLEECLEAAAASEQPDWASEDSEEARKNYCSTRDGLCSELSSLLQDAVEMKWPFVPEKWQYKTDVSSQDKTNLTDLISRHLPQLLAHLKASILAWEAREALAVIFLVDRLLYWSDESQRLLSITKRLHRRQPGAPVAPQLVLRQGKLQKAEFILSSLIINNGATGSWTYRSDSDKLLVQAVCIQVRGLVLQKLGLWLEAAELIWASLIGYFALPQPDKKGIGTSLGVFANILVSMNDEDFEALQKNPDIDLSLLGDHRRHRLLAAAEAAKMAVVFSQYASLYVLTNVVAQGTCLLSYSFSLACGAEAQRRHFLLQAKQAFEIGLLTKAEGELVASKQELHTFLKAAYSLAVVHRWLRLTPDTELRGAEATCREALSGLYDYCRADARERDGLAAGVMSRVAKVRRALRVEPQPNSNQGSFIPDFYRKGAEERPAAFTSAGFFHLMSRFRKYHESICESTGAGCTKGGGGGEGRLCITAMWTTASPGAPLTENGKKVTLEMPGDGPELQRSENLSSIGSPPGSTGSYMGSTDRGAIYRPGSGLPRTHRTTTTSSSSSVSGSEAYEVVEANIDTEGSEEDGPVKPLALRRAERGLSGSQASAGGSAPFARRSTEQLAPTETETSYEELEPGALVGPPPPGRQYLLTEGDYRALLAGVCHDCLLKRLQSSETKFKLKEHNKAYSGLHLKFSRATGLWTSRETCVYIGELSDMKGRQRNALWVQFLHQEERLSSYMGKDYQEPKEMQCHLRDVERQMTSQYYVTQFNKKLYEQKITAQIFFLPADLLLILEAGEVVGCVTVEPYMLGDFVKLTNNTWKKNDKFSATEYGVVTANGKGLTYLTDPQIHSTRYPRGPSNFGERGLRFFLDEQHGPECNSVCKGLQLPSLGRRPPTTQNEALGAGANFLYDGMGQRIRLQEMGLLNNKSFTLDALLLYREAAVYVIDQEKRKCTKKPLKDAFHPMEIPTDAVLLGQVVLGSSSSPGEGLLVNTWEGLLPAPGEGKYMSTVTEFGCIPVSSVFHTPDYGWVPMETDNSRTPSGISSGPKQQCTPLHHQAIATQNEALRAGATFLYDGLGQRIRLLEMGLLNNKSFTFDALFLYREAAVYVIDQEKRKCTKSPLKDAFHPIEIPTDAVLLGQVVLGSPTSPGEGLLVNTWEGLLPAPGEGSPPLLTGNFVMTNQNETVGASANFLYDGLGQRIRLQEMGLLNNKSFTLDALFLYREAAVYVIDQEKRKCTKNPLKDAFHPIEIPTDAVLLGQVVLGSSSSPGKYMSTVTEFGCIPVSTVFQTPDYDWVMISEARCLHRATQTLGSHGDRQQQDSIRHLQRS